MALPKIECIICFLDVPFSELSALYCGHVFHQSCITEWLRNRMVCPVCRKKVGPQDHMKLYFKIARNNGAYADGSDSWLTELNDSLHRQKRNLNVPNTWDILQCCVCLRQLLFSDIAALHCGHTFHLTCISRCIANSQKCPLCRRKTQLESIVPRLFINAQEENEHQCIENDEEFENKNIKRKMKYELDLIRLQIDYVEVLLRTFERTTTNTTDRCDIFNLSRYDIIVFIFAYLAILFEFIQLGLEAFKLSISFH